MYCWWNSKVSLNWNGIYYSYLYDAKVVDHFGTDRHFLELKIVTTSSQRDIGILIFFRIPFLLWLKVLCLLRCECKQTDWLKSIYEMIKYERRISVYYTSLRIHIMQQIFLTFPKNHYVNFNQISNIIHGCKWNFRALKPKLKAS
jgi:hypothetical protein